MWLKVLHAIGLTNLSDKQIESFSKVNRSFISSIIGYRFIRNFERVSSFINSFSDHPHPNAHIIEMLMKKDRSTKMEFTLNIDIEFKEYSEDEKQKLLEAIRFLIDADTAKTHIEVKEPHN